MVSAIRVRLGSVNYWDVSAQMSYMTPWLSEYVTGQLRILTERWVNSNIQPEHLTSADRRKHGIPDDDDSLPEKRDLPRVSLKQTSLYGIREYHRGSRLTAHIDRLTTHAASIIINVAQTDTKEPWPLEIYDHAGRMHVAVMTPGDIIYYESAMSALQGETLRRGFFCKRFHALRKHG